MFCIAIILYLEYNCTYGGAVVDYMSAKEAAEKWHITQRRVAILCAENRIPNAEILGNMWLIPADAEKPADGRSIKINKDKKAKPFVKWAGGKTQLIDEISKRFPDGFGTKIVKYAEPFVGGGAVFFEVLSKYSLEEIFIGDINEDLINCYQIIKKEPEGLIETLQSMQNDFLSLEPNNRKEYFYEKRSLYNHVKFNYSCDMQLARTALFMFLNKTCFNGLYRVNSKGLYNVPMGAYKNPLICDTENILAVSEKLQNVKIHCGDFRESAEFIDKDTFVYFDPPYRPLSNTSGFTSYTQDAFTDEQQKDLAAYYKALSSRGSKLLLSNSDPKNHDTSDNFFDDLYEGFRIDRVEAVRMINSKVTGRGKIKELLIFNYEVNEK